MHTRLTCALLLALLVCPFAPAAAPPAGFDSQRVSRLLHRLDHDNFHKRHQADTDLRAMGKAILPYLQAEQERTASLEVRHRLTVMIRDLSSLGASGGQNTTAATQNTTR